MSEAVNFQGIIGFLNRSRLSVALSADPYISLVYIQQFWDTVHQDTDVEPHVLRAIVNNTEIAISSETIRAALALGGAADNPMSYPGTLIMGCFQRMGFRGKPNDTQARKSGLVGEWRYFMNVIIQCLSPRKAGTDGLKIALQATMVALTLNKRFNFALYIYRELVMQITPAEGQGFLMYPWFIQMILNHLIPDLPQHPIRLTLTPMSKRIFTDCTKVKQQNAALIPVQTPLFGHLINPDYVEPPNDNWFHPEELAQGHVPIQQAHVNIPVNEPVQEEVVQEHEHDLGMNMDDFVNSPIHEAEGNMVTENDSSSGSSETILPVSEETDSDASRDFCSEHYERLAEVPLENAGKRIKSQARRPRRKSVRDPPSGSVLGKRTLVDECSDTDSVEDAIFVASLLVTPPRSTHVSPVTTPVSPVITPIPTVPQPSTVPSKPSNSEMITFLECQVLTLQTQVDTLVSTDSQRQLVIQTQAKQIDDTIHDTCHTESIQRKDDEDNDPTGNAEGNKDASGVNEEVLLLEFFADSEEEEAEKIECLDDIDELFNDIEDDVSDNEVEKGEIVEIEIEKNKDNVTYKGSDGLNVPYNFIQDDVIPEYTDDENVQSNIDAEADTTHTVSPNVNEEPVMYRNTGMTREQWRELVNSWMKVLPKSQAQPTQKEKYVNKERCVERIISWFYDNETKLFSIKRSDGVQYLKPRIKYFNTLPRCEMNGLASKPLINRSKFGLADVIANLIKREGGSGKYKKLNPQKGKRVRIIDQKTGKVTWKYKFKSVRVVLKISLKKIPQDFLGNMKWWYVDVNTGEARIEDKDNKVIVCFYDAMYLINFSKKDQRTLRKNEIMFTYELKEQGLQYKRVLEICRRYGVHAGSRLPDNWKSSS
ncbi:hypothetical protein L1987_30454 [Smallanthus sonchifolius]|uniref:Uncharacterized protein n=1 Tax=Smallanthus sonchifolius TaxID=185202 RepID=A0ACB9I2W0_9ASTR|nr:hypothetical protein L1987_30454 [Smallanthus sonchifolius]